MPCCRLWCVAGGCETVQGAGQDISNAGDAITEESRE
ncbi:MAG: entericidin A/B family lipoprotein, partial [Pseudomonadota bacterium]